MFDEVDALRGQQKGAYRQLPAASLDALRALPVAHPEARSVIDAHIAVAAEYLPRARALAGVWEVEWPAAMEDATRLFWQRELAIELPPSRRA